MELNTDNSELLQGIAKTGSGKTAAFVLPMIVHIMDQPEVEKGAGPIGVVVVPTRELAEQIHKETRKFSKPYQLRVAAAFGGLSKFEQFKDLKNGSEVHCSGKFTFSSLQFHTTAQMRLLQTGWGTCSMPCCNTSHLAGTQAMLPDAHMLLRLHATMQILEA